jgi:hypothetical protein
VADLGTIAFGTFVSGSSTDTALNAPTGEPVLQVIASASDTSDVHDTANTTHTGVAVFELGNTPTDFGNMDTLSVQVRYGWQSGSQVNAWSSLTVRIFQSDLTTPLTDSRTIASSITDVGGTNSDALEFTGVNTAAGKSAWDGALAVIQFGITKNMGGDALEERVFAAELTGTYTAGAASQDITPAAVTVNATPGVLTVTTGAVDITPDPVTVNATAGTLTVAAETAVADVYEDWSGYPDSTMGNPTALDGKRHWRQGANQTVDLSKAGWRIRDGVAYAGAGFTTAAGIPTDEVSATASSISSARCETDLGSADMYVRATFGELIGSPAGTGFGLFGRVGEADSLTCYYLQVRRANNEVRLFPVVNGSFGTQIGSSASHTYAAGDEFELRCFGTAISVRVNGAEVISATNSTVTSGSKAGLFANTVASGSGVRCTAWQAGLLDGSGDPVEGTPEDPIPMVLWATQVMAGTTTARVSCQMRNADLVRIVVADNAGLATPVFTSSYQAPDSLELTSFEATGLTAGTDYFYGLQVDDVTVDGVRELRTAPSGQASFTMAMSGDAGNIVTTNDYPLSIKTSNSPTYDRIADRAPAFFLFAGDRHYRDYNLDNVPAHLLALRDTFNNPRLAGLSEQLPVMQIWDDHDYTGVSDGSATGRDAAVELFRTAVPTDAWLVDTAITDPVGYTFAWGRTRWIILDHRSSRDTNDILGAAQLAALLDLLENATEELIFLYVGVPWIAGSAPLADHWGAFTGDRATIAEQIEDFAKGRVVILHADAHMLAIDDGTNTQYDTGTTDPGPPLLCAAPVDSSTSFKTGTYSEGFVPDPVGPVHQQYATIEVDDQGTHLVVTMRGWQLDSNGVDETEVITYEFTVGEPGLSITPDPVTVNATPGTLTVAPGAVDITPGAVTVNATPGTLSVVQGVSLDAPTVGVTPGTITVTTGAVDITPEATTIDVTPGTLTVANAGAGAQEITPSAVTVNATAGTLTVTTGAVDITPDPVTVTATPGSLTIGQGAVDITPEPVTVTATPGTLTLDQSVTLTAPTVDVTPGTLAVGQGIVVFPDAVTVTATPGTLTLSAGAVDITPDPVTVTATPGTLAVGLAVEVEAPTVTVTAGTLTVAVGAAGITPQPVTVQVTPGVLVLVGGDTADPYPFRLVYRQQSTLTHRKSATLIYGET